LPIGAKARKLKEDNIKKISNLPKKIDQVEGHATIDQLSEMYMRKATDRFF